MDAYATDDAGVYWLVFNGDSDSGGGSGGKCSARDSEAVAECRRRKRALRKERERQAHGIIYHKQRRKRLDWATFCSMISDLIDQYGPMDASWLVSDIGDMMGDIGTS